MKHKFQHETPRTSPINYNENVKKSKIESDHESDDELDESLGEVEEIMETWIIRTNCEIVKISVICDKLM